MNINAFKTSLMKFHKKNHRLYCVFIFKFFCNIIAEYIFLKSILFNSFRDVKVCFLRRSKTIPRKMLTYILKDRRLNTSNTFIWRFLRKILRANWHRTDAPINNSFRSKHLVNQVKVNQDVHTILRACVFYFGDDRLIMERKEIAV